jgi:hypothetical protein
MHGARDMGRLARPLALLVTVVTLATGAAAGFAAPVSHGAAARFDDSAFWRLISQTRREAGNNTGSQSSLLVEKLSKLPARSILDFAAVLKRFDKRLYSWNVWGAASVIQPGCDSACFRDFRRYVMWQGRDAYTKALTNPDSLAPLVQDANNGDWENADNPAPDAYTSATGGHYPGDQHDLSGAPSGKAFNKNDRAALRKRYPRLAAKFR